MNRHFRGLISSRSKPDRRWVRERTALIVAEELLELSLGRMRLSVAAALALAQQQTHTKGWQLSRKTNKTNNKLSLEKSFSGIQGKGVRAGTRQAIG